MFNIDMCEIFIEYVYCVLLRAEASFHVKVHNPERVELRTRTASCVVLRHPLINDHRMLRSRLLTAIENIDCTHFHVVILLMQSSGQFSRCVIVYHVRPAHRGQNMGVPFIADR